MTFAHPSFCRVTSSPGAALFFTLSLSLALLGCGGSELHSDEDCIPYTIEDCPAGESGCFDDGCGGILDCGGCNTPSDAGISDGGIIGDGGTPTGDGGSPICTPKTCTALGNQCGESLSDGCGGTLNCGCDAPNACISGTCQCEALTCADLGNPKGEAYDGCGHFIQCSGSGNTTETIRILTGNLSSSGSMTLKNGTQVEFTETWDPGPGKRILQGVRPQIALLQEMKTLFFEKNRTGYFSNSNAALRDFVTENFGPNFYAVREDRTGKNMGKPNAIVSYYPIKAFGQFASACENIQDRQHVWARIDIPGEKDLWVVSVHITTGTNSEYGSEISQRSQDVRGLIQNIKSLNIPSGDYLVIGGDFNASSRTEAALDALDASGLVYVDSESDCPIDQKGNGDTNLNRSRPYDMVLASENLKALRVAPKIGSAGSLSKRGLVIDTRKFTPLSDISPAQKSDSEAKDMQHMAVLKDFAIPR